MGVWNGWGYGMDGGMESQFFRALNFQISEAEIWQESLLFRRWANVQQLTCNIDLSRSFSYLFFSFVFLELKPFVLKGKALGEKC